MVPHPTARSRMGDTREQEIFLATLDLIGETGYDRLTLDSVAARVRASKATLYRRWASKAELVAEAVACMKWIDGDLPDTGSLHDDLLALADAKGFLDPERATIFCGLATAMFRDADLSHAVHQQILTERQNHLRTLLARAQRRGQVRPDLDLDLACSVIPAMALFRLTFETPGEMSPEYVRTVIEQILLPAVRPIPPAAG